MAQSEESVVPSPFTDPFVDDQFSTLDLRGDTLTGELNRIGAEQNPELELAPEPEPEVKPAAEVKPEPDEPKAYSFDDGSSVTIEKSSKGWKATLQPNTGAHPEVFYGGTKDELLLNLSAGKLKATQKIREMNRQIKLEGPTTPPPSAAPVEERKSLTADEVFDIKTKLADNPDLAFDTWFQKKTGMGVNELVRLARIGKSASDELAIESISNEFTAAHPEYLKIDSNFRALVGYLCIHGLGQPLAGRDPSEMLGVLYNAGKFTPEALEKAYEAAASEGFLELRSQEPEPEVEPVVEPPVAKTATAAPEQTPANGRIAREERRPRAGLGIRARETVATPTVYDKPPSVEELDNLDDGSLDKLWSDIRKSRIGTRR